MTTKHVAIGYALVGNNNVKRAWSIFTWLLYVPELVFIFLYNQSAWFSLYIHTYIYIHTYLFYTIFKYDLLKVIYSSSSNLFIKYNYISTLIWLEVSSSHTWTYTLKRILCIPISDSIIHAESVINQGLMVLLMGYSYNEYHLKLWIIV
jgi:hypothetical protein